MKRLKVGSEKFLNPHLLMTPVHNGWLLVASSSLANMSCIIRVTTKNQFLVLEGSRLELRLGSFDCHWIKRGILDQDKNVAFMDPSLRFCKGSFSEESKGFLSLGKRPKWLYTYLYSVNFLGHRYIIWFGSTCLQIHHLLNLYSGVKHKMRKDFTTLFYRLKKIWLDSFTSPVKFLFKRDIIS